MKTNRFVLLIIAIICGCWSLKAVDNRNAISFYKVGLLESAKEMLHKNLQVDPSKQSEAYYYLGKIAFKEQKLDSAAFYFEKGLSIEPSYPYNLIGLGQLSIGKDNQKTDMIWSKVYALKSKKDPEILLAIARAYVDCGNDQYLMYTQKVHKINDKLPDLYILEGDAFLAKKELGSAATSYEQAIYFDPNNEEAYLKYAQVYAELNPNSSIEMLNKYLAIHPESILAKRQLAEVDFKIGKFKDAANNYAAFVSGEGSPTNEDLARYATILFYSQEYEKALTYVDQVIKRDPKNLVMNRLKMYIYFCDNKTEEMSAQATTFMSSFQAEEYIPLDYVFYGKILKKLNKNDLAIPNFQKALEMDCTKLDLWKELANAYESTGNYTEAIRCFEHFMKTPNSPVVLSDNLSIGQTYYFAAGALKNDADSLLRKEYYQKADAYFSVVATRSPNTSIGYFWRARALSSLDPEATQGLAKPLYEKVLQIIEPEGKDKKKMIESYSYLGYYYFITNDPSTSLSYWNKVLSIDSQNEVAKRAIEGIASPQNKKSK